MRAWRYVLWLSACYAPTLPTGAPCGAGAPCPAEQACTATGSGMFCLAMSPSQDAPIDTVTDTDGDGILDAVDNCVMVANPDQDNEDSDAFGDACDPCPPYADTLPIADQDGDGISDACDPNPATAGDHIVLFDGFNHGVPAGAMVVGPWTVTGGNAVVTSLQNTRNHLSWVLPGTGSETVMTYGTVDDILGSGISRTFGVTDELDTGTERSIACEYETNGSNVSNWELIDTGTAAVIATMASPLAIGLATSLRETRAATTYTCASGALPVLSGTSSFVPTSPRIGLRTRSLSAHFAWVLIISSP